MDTFKDVTTLVPLRYQGSQKFAAMHKQAVIVGLNTVDAPFATQSNKSTCNEEKRVARERLTTYKADFVKHELPKSISIPKPDYKPQAIPFNAATTYMMDFRILHDAVDDSSCAAGASSYLHRSRRRSVFSPHD